MQIDHLPLSDITPYAKNPRKNKKGIAAVKRSIEEFGFTQPIIVNGNLVILCGHTRYEAAKALDLETVPVIIKTDLTPQQERAYRIADNRVSEETDWDKWKLRSEFSELFSEGEFFTGFTQDEIGSIMSLDLGFRNQNVLSDELPMVLFPVEIACNETQWATFQEVQAKMKKKTQVDIVMELCKMFLTKE